MTDLLGVNLLRFLQNHSWESSVYDRCSLMDFELYRFIQFSCITIHQYDIYVLPLCCDEYSISSLCLEHGSRNQSENAGRYESFVEKIKTARVLVFLLKLPLLFRITHKFY